MSTLKQSWVLCSQEPPTGHYPERVSDWVHILTPCKIYFSVVRVGAFTSDSVNYGSLWCETVMFCSFSVGIIVLEEPAAFIFYTVNDGGGRFCQILVSACQVTSHHTHKAVILHFNIIIPSRPRFSDLTFYFSHFNQNSVQISDRSCVCYMYIASQCSLIW